MKDVMMFVRNYNWINNKFKLWLNKHAVILSRKQVLWRVMFGLFTLYLAVNLLTYCWLRYSEKTNILEKSIGSEVYLFGSNYQIKKGILENVQVEHSKDIIGFFELCCDVHYEQDDFAWKGIFRLSPWEIWRIEIINRESIDMTAMDMTPKVNNGYKIYNKVIVAKPENTNK